MNSRSLLISDTEIGEFAYVYVNPENLFVAWNLYRGVIESNSSDDPGFISSFLLSILSRSPDGILPEIEAAFESVRIENFPHLPSRLNSIFAFGNLDEAKSGIFDMSLRDGVLVGIRPEGFSYRSFRGDSNWRNEALDCPSKARIFAHKYWSEEVTENPIYELLLEGRFLVHGRAVRGKAYEAIKAHEPTCLWILELSRLAAAMGDPLGTCSAYLQPNYTIKYLLRFSDKEASKVYRMALSRHRADQRFSINFEDISTFMSSRELRYPDLGSLIKSPPEHIESSIASLYAKLKGYG